jgi:hypothetical protein
MAASREPSTGRAPHGLSRLPLTVGGGSAGRRPKRQGVTRLALGLALVITAGTVVLMFDRPALPTEHGPVALPSLPRPALTPAAPPRPPVPGELRGTIRFINRLAQAVRVSGDHVGARDTMLRITDDTRILVQGRPGSFEDLREGDRVRASLQNRSGVEVARTIDVARPGR